MTTTSWLFWALLSAVFAALTAVFAKVGVSGVDSDLATLIRNLSGVHYALAGYNAGAGRVIRWKAERGPLEQAEFIDDIPFPETQIYVKKILGTAVDYRRLYRDALAE